MMQPIHRTASLIAALLLPSIAHADSYAPWPDQVFASSNGRYYVVMTRIGGPKVDGEWGPVKYVICERAAGRSPIKHAQCRVEELEPFDIAKQRQSGTRYEIHPHPDVQVHEGDRVLGRGKLQRPPLHVLVSATGLGFAGLDVMGHNYAYYAAGLESNNAVIVVNADGKIAHRRRILDLLTNAEIEPLEKSAGSMRWVHRREPGWIDEQKQELVIIGSGTEQQPDRHRTWFLHWRSGQSTRGPMLSSAEELLELKKRATGTSE